MLQAKNQKLPDVCKSSREVVEIINDDYGTNLCNRTICNYVQNGWIGIAPHKNGHPEKISEQAFESLVGAFESYILIEQANTEPQTTHKQL